MEDSEAKWICVKTVKGFLIWFQLCRYIFIPPQKKNEIMLFLLWNLQI